jgi:hypothetical protein
MALRSTSRDTDASRGRLLGEARVAYVLIEEARLRCEALADQFGDDAVLQAAHRDIGLAGFHASSNFASELRERSLNEAHSRCRRVACRGRQQELSTVLSEVLMACDAFTYVSVHSADPEVETAHVYALAAAEQLESVIDQPLAA